MCLWIKTSISSMCIVFGKDDESGKGNEGNGLLLQASLIEFFLDCQIGECGKSESTCSIYNGDNLIELSHGGGLTFLGASFIFIRSVGVFIYVVSE